jgi:hypothetical protein
MHSRCQRLQVVRIARCDGPDLDLEGEFRGQFAYTADFTCTVERTWVHVLRKYRRPSSNRGNPLEGVVSVPYYIHLSSSSASPCTVGKNLRTGTRAFGFHTTPHSRHRPQPNGDSAGFGPKIKIIEQGVKTGVKFKRQTFVFKLNEKLQIPAPNQSCRADWSR